MRADELAALGYRPVGAPPTTGHSVQASDGSWWWASSNLIEARQRQQAGAGFQGDVVHRGVIPEGESDIEARLRLEEARIGGRAPQESEEDRQRRLRGEFTVAGIELEDLLRQQAGEIGTEAQRALTREQKAIGLQESELKRQAARALAASLSTGAPVASGAATAQARQTALETGAEVGGIRAAGERRKAEIAGTAERERRLALERAASAKMERIVSEKEAGSQEATTVSEISRAEDQVQAAIKSNTDWTGLDEEDAAEDIRNLKSQYTNPKVKEYLERRAKDIAARSWF